MLAKRTAPRATLVAALVIGTVAGCVPGAANDAPPTAASVATSTLPATASTGELKSLLVAMPHGGVADPPRSADSRFIAKLITPTTVDSMIAYLDELGFVRGAYEYWAEYHREHFVLLVQFADEQSAEKYLVYLSDSTGPVPGAIDGIPGSRAFQDEAGTFHAAFFRRGAIVVDIRIFAAEPISGYDAMKDLPQRQYDLLPAEN